MIGSYHNIFRVGAILQDLGFWILNDVIWRKVNPMPNFRGTRFTNAHETLIWCAPDEKARYTFNYESMKVFNDDKQMRSDWGDPSLHRSERLKDQAGESSTQHRNLKFSSSASSFQHRNRVTWFLIPFFGTGTTGAVAKRLGRRWIGIDREVDHAEAAYDRIVAVSALDRADVWPYEKPKEQRIPFGAVERGDVQPGEILYGLNAI